MNEKEQGRKISQVIAKCWADESFKRKLLANPAATLKAAGMKLPAGLSIKVMEDTDKAFHLVIPAKPTDLADEDLDKVARGIRPCLCLNSSAGGCFSNYSYPCMNPMCGCRA